MMIGEAFPPWGLPQPNSWLRASAANSLNSRPMLRVRFIAPPEQSEPLWGQGANTASLRDRGNILDANGSLATPGAEKRTSKTVRHARRLWH
jgi:hypothetical protein